MVHRPAKSVYEAFFMQKTEHSLDGSHGNLIHGKSLSGLIHASFHMSLNVVNFLIILSCPGPEEFSKCRRL